MMRSALIAVPLLAACASAPVATEGAVASSRPPVAPASPAAATAPVAAPPASATAPAASTSGAATPVRNETASLDSPVPTVSPNWGSRVVVTGGRIYVAGPERVVTNGATGQLCTWVPGPGGWSADPTLFQLDRASRNGVSFRALKPCGPQMLGVVESAPWVGATLRVLEPRDRTVAEVAALSLPKGAGPSTFGTSFAGDGKTIVAGSADLRYENGGKERDPDPRVYLFSNRAGNWTLDGFVQAPRPDNGGKPNALYFGQCVAVSGDVLAVSSPMTLPARVTQPIPLADPACVYVYRRAGDRWLHEQRLEGASCTTDICFGIDLAAEGDLLAVRSLDHEHPEANCHVWLYARAGGKWVLSQELVPATGALQGRGFGSGLVISKGRVIVGDQTARLAGQAGTDTPGLVFVFELRDGLWRNTATLSPAGRCAPRTFGTAVAAEWPIVAVGKPRSETAGIEPGGVFVYDMSGQAPAR